MVFLEICMFEFFCVLTVGARQREEVFCIIRTSSTFIYFIFKKFPICVGPVPAGPEIDPLGRFPSLKF